MLKPVPCVYYSVTERNFRVNFVPMHKARHTGWDVGFSQFVQWEEQKLDFPVSVTIKKGFEGRSGLCGRVLYLLPIYHVLETVAAILCTRELWLREVTQFICSLMVRKRSARIQIPKSRALKNDTTFIWDGVSFHPSVTGCPLLIGQVVQTAHICNNDLILITLTSTHQQSLVSDSSFKFPL